MSAASHGFWAREYTLYLAEHRHPMNRLTHMFGIPILIATAVWALLATSWALLVAGQVLGWTLQLIGHRIEGNRPALLKRPISFLMGPLMVLVEMIGLVGWQPEFVRRAQRTS